MTKTLQVYQTDQDGWFVGITEADESPLEPGVYLFPRGAVEFPPPVPTNGQTPRFTSAGWVLGTRPTPSNEPPEAPPSDPTLRAVTALTFLERFTPDERIAIRRAARLSEGLEDWLDMLRAAQEVDLDDPRVFAGLNAIVNAGVLRFDRVPELLA